MLVSEKRYRPLYLSVLVSFVLFGVSNTVIGASLPRILDDFGWSYRSAGAVFAASSVAFFISAFLAGRLVGRIGARATLAAGFALNAVALAFFGSSPSVWVNLALNACIGAGQGLLEIGANWAVLRMSGEKSGRSLSIVHGAFAVGAVLGPVAAGLLGSSSAPWAFAFRALSALFFAMLAASFFLPLDALGRDEAAAPGGKRLSGEPAYWLGALALFLYVGSEQGVSTWAAELFKRALGASAATASVAVSVFWIGLVIGRVGIPSAFSRARPSAILAVLSLGTVSSLTVLAACALIGPAAAPLAWAAVAVAGLACSAVYPLVVSVVAAAFPGEQGSATGFASMGGGLGAFAFPYLMANAAASYGLAAGFGIYAAVAAAAAVGYRALCFFAAKKRA